MEKLHYFASPISSVPLPDKFTYPFQYTPHPLCVMAAEEVQRYLAAREEWQEELKKGKMFGVLVVRTSKGEIGYLAAFSGILAGKNQHTYFVPPVYDVQKPEGFFKEGEEKIAELGRKIRRMQEDLGYKACKRRLEAETNLSVQHINEMKKLMKMDKEERDRLREGHPDEATLEALIRQSQFQKAELKRIKQYWKDRLIFVRLDVIIIEREIRYTYEERKRLSADLQLQLFEHFKVLNARGKERNLRDIFKKTDRKTPPAGAGECAAPKLLQYAYQNGLKPLAMAEFWWGDSPKKEIRRHGYYYPACKSKCEPILKHMLQGLKVEKNPLLADVRPETELETLYEDEWLLVVNKPAGMLSVPGKLEADSVYGRMKRDYPDATGPLIVHRLDMATSGLLLIAKTKEVHKDLQAQFQNQTVEKRYIALLDGVVGQEEGTVELPLRPDPEDRPRQMVDPVHGKPAVTRYRILACDNGQSRVQFFPQTGRTHQLRVHAAHPEGLNAPVVGDRLYGKKSERLYLHAEYLAFQHPVSGKQIIVEKKVDF